MSIFGFFSRDKRKQNAMKDHALFIPAPSPLMQGKKNNNKDK